MLPNLLIIGAMKSGTTTLHRDLISHPEIFFPENKEPECLCRIRDFEESELRKYKLLYKGRSEKYLGDASTAYAKYPVFDNVPATAAKVLGKDIKIIYIVRDPISRVKSHYYHNYSAGLEKNSIQYAVENDSKYTDYSKYYTQYEKWLEYYSKEQILVLDFESYIEFRKETLSKIYNFLNISDESEFVDTELALNVGGDKLVAKSRFSKSIIESDFYQYQLKRIIPWNIRKKFASFLLSDSPKKPNLDFILGEELYNTLNNEYKKIKNEIK